VASFGNLSLALALRFQQRLALKQDASQSIERCRRRIFPELAVGRFKKAFGDSMQRPCIRGAEKIAYLLRQCVVFRKSFVDEVGSDLRSCIKAEDVIDGRCEFQAAFISMPLDALNPFRIDYAGSVDTQSLFFQVANLYCIGTGAVAEIALGCVPVSARIDATMPPWN